MTIQYAIEAQIEQGLGFRQYSGVESNFISYP